MRTYLTRLILQPEDKSSLINTLEQTRLAYNLVCKHMETSTTRLTYHVHDETYHQVRTLLPDLPSQYVIKARQEAVASFKTLKANHHKQTSEKTRLSTRLDKRLYSFKQEGDDLKIRITAGSLNHRVNATLQTYPKFLKMMRTATMKDPLIFERDGEIWLSVPFEEPEPEFIPGEVLGVDLGMRRLAVTSEGKAFQMKDHLKSRRKIRYLKRVLQSNGSQSSKRRLRLAKRKERNISKDCCHKLANSILESSKCTTIAMEDLSGIKDKKKGKRASNARSQVCYYELKRIMTYKALACGKQVETVDPAYTSQDDHRGHVRGDRKGCRYYADDGIIFDADWNAAINIAVRASKKFKHSDRPVSFSLPIDGKLDLTGRLSVDQPKCRVGVSNLVTSVA